ncbi:MAG: hypothetical protein Hals2KO_09800 [Halioglobus sp.]
MRNLLLGFLSLVVALAVLVVAGELAVRGYLLAQAVLNDHTVLLFAPDEKLGWRAAPNYRFTGELLDAAGEPYHVRARTDERGFRAFGDPAVKDRAKLMFIGDSFTHARHVSDENTYFSVLGEQLSAEVFALGVGGYGTLQQYLMLDSYLDEITPDAVIIQLCPNDFINNSFQLEFNSARNNNHKRRPYFSNGRISYRLPKPNPALWHFANEHSRLLYFLLTRLDRLRPAPQPSSEDYINNRGRSFPAFAQAVEVTGLLLAKIRERVPARVPIYAFVTSEADVFRELAEDNGIRFVPEVPRALSRARAQGAVLEAGDGAHWNNAGHRIVANALLLPLGAVAPGGVNAAFEAGTISPAVTP